MQTIQPIPKASNVLEWDDLESFWLPIEFDQGYKYKAFNWYISDDCAYGYTVFYSWDIVPNKPGEGSFMTFEKWDDAIKWLWTEVSEQ